jgi:hypothetical protein
MDPIDTEATADHPPPQKKTKKSKDFEVPEHSIPHDDAEMNQERMAIRIFKIKWRQRKEQVESDTKKKAVTALPKESEDERQEHVLHPR